MGHDGAWVPTFPNARYLMAEPDYRHFHPDSVAQRPAPRTDVEAAWQAGGLIVFEDSILPVEEQIELWSDDHQLSESIRLRPAPGHTPGASVVWLDAGKPAVFVGDLTHCPMQLHRPNDPCAWDEDFAAAAVTRKRVLTEASRRRAAVIPAHYPRARRCDGGRPRGRVHGRRLAGAAADLSTGKYRQQHAMHYYRLFPSGILTGSNAKNAKVGAFEAPDRVHAGALDSPKDQAHESLGSRVCGRL